MKRDYFAVEYTAVRHVLQAIGEDWQRAEHLLPHRDERVIDELVVNVKDVDAPERQGRRRQFLDITIS